MKEEVRLMKGNEAIAHAAIRYGCDGYFGYPITPQSEVLETLEELMPWETTGMTVLQAESELAAINMVYGGAATGKAVMTSSSSPGISLKQEGISYIAAAELPEGTAPSYISLGRAINCAESDALIKYPPALSSSKYRIICRARLIAPARSPA